MYKIINIYIVILLLVFSAQSALSQKLFELVEESPSCDAQIDIPYGNLNEPIINKDTAFIGSYSKENECYIVYGISFENGNPKFKHCMKSMNYCYDERTIYIAEKNGDCLAIENNEKLKWKVNLKKEIFHRPVIKGSTIYITSMDNTLIGLNSQNGDKRYEIKGDRFKGNITSPPAVNGKFIYITTSEGIIYRLTEELIDEVTKGKTDKTTKSKSDEITKDKLENMGYIKETPLFTNESMFVANTDTVFEISLSSQNKNSYNTKLGVIDKIFIESGYLIVTGENQIECLKIGKMQEPLWKWSGDYQAIALDSQNVFIGSNNVIAINIHDGKQSWNYNEKSKSLADEEIKNKIADKGYILPDEENEIIAKFQDINGQNIVSLQVLNKADHKIILVGTDKRKYYAINENGKMIWSKIYTYSNLKFSATESLTYISVNDEIYQFDLLGANLTKCLDVGIAGNFQFIADNEFLYIISDFGVIYKFSQKDKGKVWDTQISDTEGLFPILSKDGNTLLITSRSGYIYGINTKDGSNLYTKRIDSLISCSSIIYENRLYIGSDDGKLFGIDIKNNDIFLNFDTKLNDRVIFISLSQNNILCVGTKSGKLLAFSINSDGTLSEKWSKNYSISSSPAIDESNIYFGADNGKLYAVQLISGNELWDYQIDAKIKGDIAIGSGIIYFTSDDSILHAIDKIFGSSIWKYFIYGQSVGKPQFFGNNLYLLSSIGTLYILKKPDIFLPIDSGLDKISRSDYDRQQQIISLNTALKTDDNSLEIWQKLLSASYEYPDSVDIKAMIWKFLESDWAQIKKMGFQIKTDKGIFSLYIDDAETKKLMTGDIKLMCLLQFMSGANYISSQDRTDFISKLKNYKGRDPKNIRKDIYNPFIDPIKIWGTKSVSTEYKKFLDLLNKENADFSNAIDELRKIISNKKSENASKIESLISDAIKEIKSGNNEKAREFLSYNKLNPYIDLGKQDPQILLMLLRSAWLLKKYADDDFLSKIDKLWEEAFCNKEIFLNNSEICFYYADILWENGDIEKAMNYYQYSIDLRKNELSCYRMGNIYLGDYLKSPSLIDTLAKADDLFSKAIRIHSSRSEKSSDLYDKIMINTWDYENISSKIKINMLVAQAFDKGYENVDSLFNEVFFSEKTAKQLFNEAFRELNDADMRIALNLLAIYAHKYKENSEKISELENCLSEYQNSLIDIKLIQYYLLLAKAILGSANDELDEPPNDNQSLYFQDFYIELEYLYARFLETKKDYGKAIIKYEAFIDKSKNSLYFSKDEYLYYIGNAYYKSVFPDELDELALFKHSMINDPIKRDYLEKSIGWLSKVADNKYSERQGNMIANSCYALGEWQKASEQFVKMKKENYRLAQCYINLGKYQEAKNIAENLSKAKPDDLFSLYLLTLSAKKSGGDIAFQINKDALEKKINSMPEEKEREEFLRLLNENIK